MSHKFKFRNTRFFSGQNVRQEDLDVASNFQESQREFSIFNINGDGVFGPFALKTSSLKVVSDGFRNNAKFEDLTSLTEGNPLTIGPSDGPKKIFGQKFRARSNNIQKIRLFVNSNTLPGSQLGNVVVEIRELIGTGCEIHTSCTCESSLSEGDIILSDPSNKVLARAVLDHNQINNSFNFVDVNFSTQTAVSGFGGESEIVAGNFYAVVISRDFIPTGTSININGSFGKDLNGTDGFAIEFTPETGAWINRTGDQIGFRVYSSTIAIEAGIGFKTGKPLFIPETVIDDTGVERSFILGNIDLAHVNNLDTAGTVENGEVGRNAVIIRSTVKGSVPEPNPRTGNPIFSREDIVVDVEVVDEKTWIEQIDKEDWELLAFVIDDNPRITKGIYEEPCDLNAAAIVGNWSVSKLSIEDCRRRGPSAKSLVYDVNDDLLSVPSSNNAGASLQLPVASDTMDCVSGFLNSCEGTNCSPLVAWDAGNALMLSDSLKGKYAIFIGADGQLTKKNIVPPNINNLAATIDPSSAARQSNVATTTGACPGDNIGLKIRLDWTYPSLSDISGVVIVRSNEDFPRNVMDGDIIAATHRSFTTTDGRLYDFSPRGAANICCEDSTEAGLIGTLEESTNENTSSPLMVFDNNPSASKIFDVGGSANVILKILNTVNSLWFPVFSADLVFDDFSHSVYQNKDLGVSRIDPPDPSGTEEDNQATVITNASFDVPSTVEDANGDTIPIPEGPVSVVIRIYDSTLDPYTGSPGYGEVGNEIGRIVVSGFINDGAITLEQQKMVIEGFSSSSICYDGKEFTNMRVDVQNVSDEVDPPGETFDTIGLTIVAMIADNMSTFKVFEDENYIVSSVAPQEQKDTLVSFTLPSNMVEGELTLFYTLTDSSGNIIGQVSDTCFVIDVDTLDTGVPCSCYVDSFGGDISGLSLRGCDVAVTATPCEGLSYNLVYHYTMFSYNDCGHFSEIATCAQAEYGFTDATPPGGVCNFNAVKSTGGIRLTWKNPIDDDFTGVRIFASTSGFVKSFNDTTAEIVYDTALYSQESISSSVDLAPGAFTSFIDNEDNIEAYNRFVFQIGGDNSVAEKELSPLAGGTEYFYTVFTYDEAGNFSVPVCIERDTAVSP